MSDIISQLRQRAAKTLKRIVFPEGTDPRVLQAAATMVQTRMVHPILVGSPTVIEEKAKSFGIRLDNVEVVDPTSASTIDRYARILIPEWRSKGITEIEAARRLEAPMYLAAAMVRSGDADGFVGGAATTTADTVRAAIQCIGLSRTSSVVSSFFLMVLSNSSVGVDGALIYADCAVVPMPTVPQLADIAIDAAENARI